MHRAPRVSGPQTGPDRIGPGLWCADHAGILLLGVGRDGGGGEQEICGQIAGNVSSKFWP